MSDDELCQSSIYYNMLGSMTSGLLARFPCHPLDTCKAKLQVQQTSLINSEYQALKQTSISMSDPHLQSKYLLKIRNIPLIGRIIAGHPNYETLSTANHRPIAFKNTWDVLIRTFQREGIAGLYRGIFVSILGGCPASCVYFTTYESTRRYLNQRSFFIEHNYLSDFVGGFTAEIVACLIWVPVDIIKERLQVQSIIDPQFRYKSTLHAFKQMFVHEGIEGLYKAYGATIVSFGPFSAIYLSIYEQLKYKCVHWSSTLNANEINDVSQLPVFYIALSACTAGAVAAVVTNPLDMIKLRMQVQRGGIYHFGYRNIFHGLKMVVEREGYWSLFHGCGARVLFWVPNLAVNLTMYESFTRFYKRNLSF